MPISSSMDFTQIYVLPRCGNVTFILPSPLQHVNKGFKPRVEPGFADMFVYRHGYERNAVPAPHVPFDQVVDEGVDAAAEAGQEYEPVDLSAFGHVESRAVGQPAVVPEHRLGQGRRLPVYVGFVHRFYRPGQDLVACQLPQQVHAYVPVIYGVRMPYHPDTQLPAACGPARGRSCCSSGRTRERFPCTVAAAPEAGTVLTFLTYEAGTAATSLHRLCKL